MKYRLRDLAQIKYGKDHKKLKDGNIPVYGTGGLMRKVNEYLYDGKSVLIPRKGSLNNVMYVTGKFWTVDTMFWTHVDDSKVIPKYLYYCLSKMDLESLNVGSAVPSLTTKILNEIILDIPPKEKQKEIIDKLAPIEEKVRLNNKINDNFVVA
ncbi:MAG: restriction endonuclease subunit S [Ligilactobacillus agilis]|uniref:restriction endonuclease subunit S n=1 Tax=Ligilactobacillus agilis TaxID=1601 RepID=UPI00242E1E4E|nr:restriction endonuclease subunit S [Ligilactobacillus agilis]MCI5761007.1 restriction endonuclease subunit S [Ligilactobacillus agilis]